MASWFFHPMAVVGKFIHSTVVAGGFSLPNGSYPVGLHKRSVTSSIMGLRDGVSYSGLLRATLPMDVVTISMYVTPIVLSFTMWLVHMVANPGMVTISTVSGLGDIPGSPSGASSFLQAGCHPLKATYLHGWSDDLQFLH